MLTACTGIVKDSISRRILCLVKAILPFSLRRVNPLGYANLMPSATLMSFVPVKNFLTPLMALELFLLISSKDGIVCSIKPVSMKSA